MTATGPEGPALICYDGSAHADGAIRRAASLLRGKSALVMDASRGPFGGNLAEAGRDVGLAAGFGHVDIVGAGHGPPALVVPKEARTRGASVIVVAARGASHGPLGGLAAALVERSDVPVLVADAKLPPAPSTEPVFLCFDGSRVARQAVATGAKLLAGRAAIVAAFLPAVDDGAVLSANLPWPATGETQDRLARMDREEAAAPAARAAEGARLATAAGLAAHPVGIAWPDGAAGDDEEPWEPLLRAAAREDAACIVVGHRRQAKPPVSTAHAVLRHADRAVLVVPGR